MAASVDLALLAANCVVAATLVQAGLSKLAVPAQLHRALTELGAPVALADPRTIRLYAGIECAAGVALLFSATRLVGAGLVAAVGVTIIGLGWRGATRGSAEPCGCFGSPTGRPLGLGNVAIGVGLVTAGAANLARPAPTGSAALLGAALALLLLCLLVNRAWAWPLIRPRRGATS